METGIYMIRNGDNFVGRYPIEDRSLNPKRVVVMPPNMQPLPNPWMVEANSDGTYNLMTGGSPGCAAIDQKLYAALIEEMVDSKSWTITPAGEGNFVVQKPGEDAVWDTGNAEPGMQAQGSS
ncbi:hypothetical protein FRB95_007060 [Tulasnella sp. JGI-2019a]|nr:hypothetical protein FRB95_007060 [Tulasnella sp. JGI-2019a]